MNPERVCLMGACVQTQIAKNNSPKAQQDQAVSHAESFGAALIIIEGVAEHCYVCRFSCMSGEQAYYIS